MKEKKIVGSRKYRTICLYSESGAGKTSLAATAPRPVFADSNKGTVVLAGRKGLEHVRSVDINKFEDLDGVYDNFLGVGEVDWSRTGKNYQTLVVDHLDDIQNIITDELVEEAMEDDDKRDDVVEMREWGIMFQKMRRYIRKFKTVPCHKIFICGESEDDEGRKRPSLSGQLKDKLPYLVDDTLYLRINQKTGVRYIHLNPTEDFYAKTRATHLSEKERKIRVDFDNPHMMADVLALLAGERPSKKSKRDR